MHTIFFGWSHSSSQLDSSPPSELLMATSSILCPLFVHSLSCWSSKWVWHKFCITNNKFDNGIAMTLSENLPLHSITLNEHRKYYAFDEDNLHPDKLSQKRPQIYELFVFSIFAWHVKTNRKFYIRLPVGKLV